MSRGAGGTATACFSFESDIVEFLYHDVKSAWQYIETFAMQRDDLAIDHYIHWGVQVKIHTTHLAYFGQRMPRMRAVIKCWQVPNQANAADWPPAHVLV